MLQNLEQCISHLEKAGEILTDVSIKVDRQTLNEKNVLNNLYTEVLRKERELISQDDWSHYVQNYFPTSQIKHVDSNH